MFKLALRQVQFDLFRTLITALALGSVIAVVLVLEGFEQGQYRQLERLVINRQADLIATQAGVTNFTAVRSSIPQLSRAEVEAVPGVVNAHPITAVPIIYNKNNTMTPVYVLVFDTRGGPYSITQGRSIEQGADIVIDQSLVKIYGLKIGDKFMVSDFEFTVSGITQEAGFFMPFAFIGYDGMIDLFLESQIAPDLSTFPLLSYMLIELAPGTDKQKIMVQIEEQVPSVDVFTSDELAANDVNMGRSFFEPIMGLLVMVAYVIGLLVVGLIMYADVRSRRHQFAVLKALGFPFSRLMLTVMMQTMLLLAIALPLGVVLGQSIALSINTVSPLYLVYIFNPEIFWQTLLASLAFAFFGAMLPMRSVNRVDPVDAFQGA